MSTDDEVLHWEQVDEATELLLEGDPQRALVVLKAVLDVTPTNPYAYHYLGVCFYELKRLDAARDAHQAALRLSPEYLAARVALSHVLRQLGDTQGALAEAKTALQLFKKDGDAMYARSLAHAARGELAFAKRFMEGFLESGPPFEAQLEARSMLEMMAQAPEGKALEFEA